VPTVVLKQPQWTQDLSLGDIPARKGSSRVVLHKNLGFRVTEYQETLSAFHETDVADDAVYELTVPAGILRKPSQRRPSELTGADVSALRLSGDEYYKKVVGDTESWAEAHLSADVSAFPRPDSTDYHTPNVPMDRVGITPNIHRPDEGWSLRFYVPGIGGNTAQELVAVYFTGIPGEDVGDDSPGIGHYLVSLWGDGSAYLLEKKLNGTWAIRKQFIWTQPNQISGAWHVLRCRSDAYQDPTTNKWTGRRILFDTSNVSGGVASLLSMAVSFIRPYTQEYVIPRRTPGQVIRQPELEPIRVEVRRTVRAEFQLSRTKFYPTGKVRIRHQRVPAKIFLSSEEPIYVTAFGQIPPGCSFTIEMFRTDTGALLSQVFTTGDDQTFLQCGFTPVDGVQDYYADVTLVSRSDGFACPTLRRTTFYRKPISEVRTGTEVVVPLVTAVSLSGPDADPSHETMQFTAPDLGGVLSLLDIQAGQSVALDLFYDPEDETKFSRLFLGTVYQAKKRIRGAKRAGTTWPRSKWGTYEVTCVGQWARIAQRKNFTQRFNFADVDPTDNIAPYKVTTALRALFKATGLLETQFDIPAHGARLYTDPDAQDSLIVEPYAEIMPIILRWVREYLGGYVVFDANATNGGDPDDILGCWRVLIPPSPPYNVLCNFLDGSPAGGIVVDPASYPDDGATKQTFIRKWSRRQVVEPPEGNWVIVDGVNGGMPQSTTLEASGGQQVHRQAVYNWAAADFGQGDAGPQPAPDPTHPDWTTGDPVLIYYSDPALVKQEAVDLVTMRTYDLCCHAKLWNDFESPLVLIVDATDPLQIRPRPLRYGDVVQVTETLSIMNSVSAKWSSGQGKNQHAAYETFSVPALSEAIAGTDQQYKAIMAREV
jgi:hypothetical protein